MWGPWHHSVDSLVIRNTCGICPDLLVTLSRMGWTFSRRGGPEQLDAETLIAKARAEAASRAVPVSRRAPVGAVDFRMVIDDVFYIAGRGVVVTGEISAGEVRVDDPITITRRGRRRNTTVVEAIEQFRERLERAKAGDTVGLQLAEISRREIASGDVLTSPR
jgi:translation elongation factor EF-Tu-like GTPase